MQAELKNTQIEYIEIGKVKPYEKNARFNDKAVEAVAKSIKEYGFKNPIIVDKNFVIIAGHTRLKAAQKLKLATVPVIVASDLTPQQVKAFRLADNKTGELADWNFDLLSKEVQELMDTDYNVDLLGFKDGELDALINSAMEDVSSVMENMYRQPATQRPAEHSQNNNYYTHQDYNDDEDQYEDEQEQEDEEYLPIAENSNTHTKSFDRTIRIDNIKIVLTEKEYNGFMQRYYDYVDENGVSFGFIGDLLCLR